MGVLTEYNLRAKLKNSDIKELTVEKGVIITPSAKQYLQERNIKLTVGEKADTSVEVKKKESKPFKKPEFMTALYGTELAYKDHPIIKLRGKLDSLQAKTLSAQVMAHKAGKSHITKDLQSILEYERKIMIAEIMKEAIEDNNVMGYSFDEIRLMSHNPKKYFGVDHIWYPSYEYGEIFAAVNEIRTQVREAEVIAMMALRNGEEIAREDIIKALNRLSSYVYVLMCKILSENK
ncbi:ethanolamine utilization cobalamin adenosyltransferase [Hathewaya proteolytica DSM 3090]|uniref:Ethanolamine utilization cobalamin adenosyltransferase n=1 Tax=Hathewaya proteolytica DSM 3090 TaxID=1121331 RepID=A0A1M6KCC0_9CLOT|nr:hypothetical protein [Hathewaya proteolytica]SHJ56572.1 ethanolamine utilization cobalamin adenosyltransferase [Hathewaya proteolytica DSM 3090]